MLVLDLHFQAHHRNLTAGSGRLVSALLAPPLRSQVGVLRPALTLEMRVFAARRTLALLLQRLLALVAVLLLVPLLVAESAWLVISAVATISTTTATFSTVETGLSTATALLTP